MLRCCSSWGVCTSKWWISLWVGRSFLAPWHKLNAALLLLLLGPVMDTTGMPKTFLGTTGMPQTQLSTTGMPEPFDDGKKGL